MHLCLCGAVSGQYAHYVCIIFKEIKVILVGLLKSFVILVGPL